MVPRVVPTAVAALGLVLAVVGVVMLTVAAPPQQVGGQVLVDGVMVTGPGVLALTGEPVEVATTGEAFVGLGRQDEVTAWLSGVGHTRVDGVSDPTTVVTTPVAGAARDEVDPPADPALADIWQQEQTGADPTTRVDAPQPGDVLVVAARGPATVDLRWQRPVDHPGAWPLLVLGVAVTVLGAAWLRALNRRRRRVAGRRP